MIDLCRFCGPRISDAEHLSSADGARRVLIACPNYHWWAIISIARYGGLRCPSEVLSLRWENIDWAGKKLPRDVAEDRAPPWQGDSPDPAVPGTSSRPRRGARVGAGRHCLHGGRGHAEAPPGSRWLDERQPPHDLPEDHQAGRARPMGSTLPQPPQFPPDRAGRDASGPSRLRLAGQQRGGGDDALPADDRGALQPGGRADSHAKAGGD